MNKTYCFTDIHGEYELWKQVRDFADETDTLIFLGDAIDRGPDGIKIMMEMLNDTRVIYLKGNHEDFMCRYRNPSTMVCWTSSNNGGRATYEALIALPEEERDELIERVWRLPAHYLYENKSGQKIHLTHAGFTPYEDDVLPEIEDLLWDRYHFINRWPKDDELKDVYIIHGHTPVQRIAYKLRELDRELGMEIDRLEYDIDGDPNVLVYADGHKVALDLSHSNYPKVALWDLDEMKIAAYFFGKTKKEE